MVSTLLASILLVQGGGQAPTTDAAGIISKMFAYYNGTTSLSGTIHMTQSAAGHSVTLDTEIAFVAPSKLYIKQYLNGAEPKTWLVTSDGKVFSYDVPNTTRFAKSRPTARLMETVQPGPVALTYRDIYHATALSLGDRSVPLDLAIGSVEEMRAIRDQSATVVYGGHEDLNGVSVNVINGQWREYGRAPVSGTYQMMITDDGQLKRYSRKETLAIDEGNGARLDPQQVTTVWDVNLQVNAKPDESVFAVVR